MASPSDPGLLPRATLLRWGRLLRRRLRRVLRLRVLGDELQALLLQRPPAGLKLFCRPRRCAAGQPELASGLREGRLGALGDAVEVAGHTLGPGDVVEREEARNAVAFR